MPSISFEKRKFLFFLGLAVIGFGVYFLWQHYGTSKADFDVYTNEFYPSNYKTMEISIDSRGEVLVNGTKNRSALKFYKEYDEFRLLVFDNPGEFISGFKANLHLPANSTGKEIEPIVYAIHGIGSAKADLIDSQTVVYDVSDISPQSTLTIVANLPKGMVTPNFFQRLGFAMRLFPVQIWLYIAIALPGLTIIMMGFVLFRRRSDQIFATRGILGSPPEKTSPAVAGVLIDGVVGAREIAATLIDLARRGYIIIVNKGDGNFTFGKKKPGNFETIPGLNDFERVLLTKIFTPEAYKSTIGDVEMRIGRHVFSRKIAQFYLEIYNQATNLGYFIKNPAKVHLAWKYTGIVLFFLSFVGFMVGAVTEVDPKYGLFFWVGGMVAAAVIIRFSGFMPARSAKGSQELQEWLAFREYLTDKRLAAGIESLQGRFEEYLPFALVLGAEVEWARRFREEPFVKPDWYDSRERVVTLENFAQELFPLIGYVAENLARSHEPTVE